MTILRPIFGRGVVQRRLGAEVPEFRQKFPVLLGEPVVPKAQIWNSKKICLGPPPLNNTLNDLLSSKSFKLFALYSASAYVNPLCSITHSDNCSRLDGFLDWIRTIYLCGGRFDHSTGGIRYVAQVHKLPKVYGSMVHTRIPHDDSDILYQLREGGYLGWELGIIRHSPEPFLSHLVEFGISN